MAQCSFFVVNVQNPPTAGMNVGVEMSIYQSDSDCGANTRNEHCAIFEARGYYVTTSATENLQTTSSTYSILNHPAGEQSELPPIPVHIDRHHQH